MSASERPDVPEAMLARLRRIMHTLPETAEEPAWMGIRWRVRQATIAHVFGGEDQRFRITFHAEADEVLAFEHLGPPYFRADWGVNIVGLILDDDTDWTQVAESVTDSYCILAPAFLSAQVARPQA